MKTNITIVTVIALLICSEFAWGHGTCISPSSRVYRIYQSNIENPSFQLARNAIDMDSPTAYYTWSQVSRNIPEAVMQGLPPGFDYSPWVPDGQIASGGRVDPAEYGQLTYSGLDQVSEDWPSVELMAGEIIEVDYIAHTPHEPSVWDVWMTTPDWNSNTALNWNQMEFLGRPNVVLVDGHYYFDLEIPTNRSGKHVLWIAWHRNDPVGEVFFSCSDITILGVEDCPDALTVEQITQSTYSAASSIVCNAQIMTTGEDLILKAGNYVELDTPFEIVNGSSLSIILEGCN